MDNRLLIWFAIFLGAFLGLPIVMQAVRGGTALQTQGAEAGAPAASAATPAADPRLNQPPLLNERNLIGTEWLMETGQYRIKVTVAPNGVLYATNPILKSITGLDYLEGRWRIAYDKLYLQANIGGQHWAAELTISGDKIFSNDGEVPRFTSF